ncbi:MAG: sodium:alanine symporter family protein, partial [Alphaproteobacteria bacterium]
MLITNLHAVFDYMAGVLWGWPMLILLVGTGIWLTLQLRGLTFTLLGPAMLDIFRPQQNKGEGTISNRSALFTALAATVGTGNIAGVATAIVIGGPGAMFWMWVSGLFGMALKYSETLLGVHYRIKTADGTFRGGPMYYLTHGANQPILGMAFALFLSFAALSIGGMVQSNSVADALKSTFNFNPTIVGAIMVVAAALIMFGGLKRIARVADATVPFMIALYAISGTLVIVANAAYVPELFARIFTEAFTGTAATGGFAGATVLMAMRYGLARGVFANEAGLGSAPIVAATAQTRHPTEQALISMTQTFIDTFLVCTFTGMVILVTGAWQSGASASGGASLTQLAFNTGLGGISLMGYQLGSLVVSVCLLLFAFTTVLGWGYYGQQGFVYLFGKKVATPYMVFFLLCTFFGAAVLDLASSVKEGVAFIWVIADVTTGLMMLPNLLALWLLGPKIRQLTFDYLKNKKTGN